MRSDIEILQVLITRIIAYSAPTRLSILSSIPRISGSIKLLLIGEWPCKPSNMRTEKEILQVWMTRIITYSAPSPHSTFIFFVYPTYFRVDRITSH